MGLIGTRSLTKEIPGINDLVIEAEDRIRRGIIAYDALMTVRDLRADDAARGARNLREHSGDLGFAFLLLRYVEDPREATDAQIAMAAADTIPASRLCSGRSASWSGSVSPSSR
jgi:cytochrome d ubiquinol oxidase subunit I